MGEASAWARAVASAVSELRNRVGLTVQELADRIGKDPSYLYGRLNGSAPFNINDWELLARALGVHPIEIARLAAKFAADEGHEMEPTIKLDPTELSRRLGRCCKPRRGQLGRSSTLRSWSTARLNVRSS